MKYFYAFLNIAEFLFAILGFWITFNVIVAVYTDTGCLTVNDTTYGTCQDVDKAVEK